MNELRWFLLILGLAVLVAIYMLGRRQQLRRRRRRREELDSPENTADVRLETRPEQEDVPPEPEHFHGLQNLLREEAETLSASTAAGAPEPKPKPKPKPINRHPAERPAVTGDKIVSLYVVARRSSVFRGEAISKAVEGLNLDYGDMQVFNRVIERNGRRHILFSMANAVKPGTFEFATLQGVTTPGVVFFMQLPGPLESLKAFNAMLDCAQRLAIALDAELLDEAHSALSNQTIDHLREEIQLHSLRTARVRMP